MIKYTVKSMWQDQVITLQKRSNQKLSKKELKWLKATSSLFPELENELNIYTINDGKPYEC